MADQHPTASPGAWRGSPAAPRTSWRSERSRRGDSIGNPGPASATGALGWSAMLRQGGLHGMVRFKQDELWVA